MSELIADAASFAISAHSGQVDKLGVPYALHLQHVASSFEGEETYQAVAWLHDIRDLPISGAAFLFQRL